MSFPYEMYPFVVVFFIGAILMLLGLPTVDTMPSVTSQIGLLLCMLSGPFILCFSGDTND